MINFQISETSSVQASEAENFQDLLEAAAGQALAVIRPDEDCELTLVLSDDEQLHELNREFLGVDAPTDVLSFPADELDPDTGAQYLGDIILSLPRARAQASAGGHPTSAELQLLVVHGVLHLLGYDHGTAEEKAAMWERQAEILTLLSCPITAPTTE
jgi:probable rRNA maturation factor